jgi:phosphoribosyl-ATP pyrophosphohydrolase/phosphoribosyl-AMP cyclohydrolase
MIIPDNLKYDDKGLIPAVIQDWKSHEVLMVAYMNADSLKKTVETGLTCFWSRSRRKFWQKGETSGHVQRVKDILYDCDQDTLLIKVDQTGPACHTGAQSCFFRSFSGKPGG